jgi:DNA-binding NarL/FixJ family response regulator
VIIDMGSEQRPAASAQEPGSGGVRALVVEDSVLVRRGMIRLLSSVKNVRVIAEAETAAQALDRVVDLQPDIVILDVRLAEGTGFDVLRGMRTLSARPCVIVTSNHVDVQTRRECLALGADFFFDKSRELAELRIAVASLADRLKVKSTDGSRD